ncbi:acetyl-CoA synthetase-like protein [Hysterangium stoloniferum]|nr:acetyl-CoA synthetase-like protein [Hysterangium stoloniferum]
MNRMSLLNAYRSAAVFARRLSLRRGLFSMSSLEGALDPPLNTSTLPEYFRSEILAKYNSRPALICPQESPRPHGGPKSQNFNDSRYLAWDFQEFDRHIQALSRGLLALGVQKGDRVGVVMGNTSAYALLQWACARVGAILVTFNPAYRAHEFVSALKLAGVSTLFIVPGLRTSDYIAMLSAIVPSLTSFSPRSIAVEALPKLKSLVLVDNVFDENGFKGILTNAKCAIDFRDIFIWQDSALDEQIEHLERSMDKDDIINLQFTSGTTGAPKAVSLTHQLLNNALSIGRCMRLTPEDKLCNVPPLYHCFGLVLGNLAAWVHGSCVVYPSESFHPKAIVDALVREQCTALHGVPTHFLGILEEIKQRGNVSLPMLRSVLRTGIAAGSPIPEELMRQLIDKLNLTELTIAYGMSIPVSFQTVPADPIKKRVETVGRIQPHVKAKVIDPQGNVVPVNQPGELCVAGYLVQKGYWEDPGQTASAMRRHPGNLWMHTGDEVIMDEEGYLRGFRYGDIIIRGGENLFPVQIENALTNHSSIREAAVIAVPDPVYGEVVGAWLVRKSDEPQISRTELRQWVGEQMNPQSRPSWVWYVGEDGVEDELPKTASGKVQKHILREWGTRWAKLGVGKV